MRRELEAWKRHKADGTVIDEGQTRIVAFEARCAEILAEIANAEAAEARERVLYDAALAAIPLVPSG